MRHPRLHRHLHLSVLPSLIVFALCFLPAQVVASPQSGILPPAPHAAHVQITEDPLLESMKGSLAIIRWTSNNPGGTDEHFGLVHYGTDPNHLDQTAKSHVRLNQNHPDTIFRVRVDGLKPHATYYYTVESMQSTGKSDGMASPVSHFVTP